MQRAGGMGTGAHGPTCSGCATLSAAPVTSQACRAAASACRPGAELRRHMAASAWAAAGGTCLHARV